MRYGIDKFDRLWVADENWNKVGECKAFTRMGNYTKEAKALLIKNGIDPDNSSEMHTEDTMEQSKEFDDLKERLFAKYKERTKNK